MAPDLTISSMKRLWYFEFEDFGDIPISPLDLKLDND
jgi:hypothetical protein